MQTKWRMTWSRQLWTIQRPRTTLPSPASRVDMTREVWSMIRSITKPRSTQGKSTKRGWARRGDPLPYPIVQMQLASHRPFRMLVVKSWIGLLPIMDQDRTQVRLWVIVQLELVDPPSQNNQPVSLPVALECRRICRRTDSLSKLHSPPFEAQMVVATHLIRTNKLSSQKLKESNKCKL